MKWEEGSVAAALTPAKIQPPRSGAPQKRASQQNEVLRKLFFFFFIFFDEVLTYSSSKHLLLLEEKRYYSGTLFAPDTSVLHEASFNEGALG